MEAKAAAARALAEREAAEAERRAEAEEAARRQQAEAARAEQAAQEAALLAAKVEMRGLNLGCERLKITELKALDSSLKKNQAFIKKCVTLGLARVRVSEPTPTP